LRAQSDDIAVNLSGSIYHRRRIKYGPNADERRESFVWNRVRIDVIEVIPLTATPSGKRFADTWPTITQPDIPISAACITKFREATVLEGLYKFEGLCAIH
jgi:hypothetical protein